MLEVGMEPKKTTDESLGLFICFALTAFYTHLSIPSSLPLSPVQALIILGAAMQAFPVSLLT
jgi:hypothetical protein